MTNGGWRGHVDVREVRWMKIIVRSVESVKSTQWPDS